MDLPQLISDLIAYIVLRPSLYFGINTLWLSYAFFVPVIFSFFDIFAGNRTGDIDSGALNRINIIQNLPKVFSLTTNLLIITICSLVALRGLQLPVLTGETNYRDDYISYSIQIPKNWVVSYEKPASDMLDQYLSTNNITLKSKDSNDYIFIGEVDNFIDPINAVTTIDTGKKNPVEIIYHHKISTFRDELMGFAYKDGRKLLVAGYSDGALLRYFFSTLK